MARPASRTRPGAATFGAVGFLIYDVARLLREEARALAAAGGLPQSQWRALVHLSRMQGCRQNELADTLEVRPVSLGRVVDQLEAAGLVERRADPSDRRARRLHLTARATPVLRQLRQRASALHAGSLAGLPGSDETAMIAGLERMRSNLQRRRERRRGGAPR